MTASAINGRLPKKQLFPSLGKLFTEDAAWGLNKAAELYKKEFGVYPICNSGYRPLGEVDDPWYLTPATQFSVWNK